jgi:hypothetical protein
VRAGDEPAVASASRSSRQCPPRLSTHGCRGGGTQASNPPSSVAEGVVIRPRASSCQLTESLVRAVLSWIAATTPAPTTATGSAIETDARAFRRTARTAQSSGSAVPKGCSVVPGPGAKDIRAGAVTASVPYPSVAWLRSLGDHLGG